MKSVVNFFKELGDRLMSPTPEFWQKVRSFATFLGVSATTVFTLNNSFELELNSTFIEICKYLMVSMATLVGSASLTKTDGILNK